ncbi:hypothetical protein REMIM1_CH00454 [Rhizobium etli bv. mimosae str. Mim1]|nr:hypothetical protein REMIM1_CH00454 [Rhizobium etli bv. mimosae str. Mim1]
MERLSRSTFQGDVQNTGLSMLGETGRKSANQRIIIRTVISKQPSVDISQPSD